MSLFRPIATVGGLTLLSRVTGLAREMMVAHFLGASAVADAFFVAFRFPNLFRSLFAEGALNAAFVPLYTGKLTEGGQDEADRFAAHALSLLALALSLFVAVMEMAMPWAMMVLAPGFADVPGKSQLAVEFSRICFPYLLFISMTALQSGILNSVGRFAAAAGTPILLNLVSMLGLWVLAPYTETPGHALAWGTFASGVAQFSWLIFSVRKAGVRIRFALPELSPDMRTLFVRMVPGAIGAGVYQVNLVVNTMIASTVANGAVSYLNYADRVNQLPLGVVGIAIGTALLPLLSRQIRQGEGQAALVSQNRALEVGLLLTVPAAAALMSMSHPVIQLLFQRGSFGPEATTATAHALIAFAGGLPAYVLVKILTPAFFARHDTSTPVRVAAGVVVANVTLNLALAGPLGHVGMALATAVAAWFNVAALTVILARRGYFHADARLLARAPRILAAAAVMAAAIHILSGILQGWMATESGLGAAVGVLVAAGLAVFAVAAHFLGAASVSDVKSIMRRRS